MAQQGQQPSLPPHLVNIDTRSKPQGQQPPIYTPNILPQQSQQQPPHPQQVPIQNSATYDPTMAPMGASTRRDVLPPQPQYEEFVQELPPYQDAEFEARKQQQYEEMRREQAMYAKMQQELFEQQQREAMLEQQRQQQQQTSLWSFDAMKLAAIALLAAFILPFVLHAVSLHLGYPPCNTKISAISALGVGGVVYAAQLLQ